MKHLGQLFLAVALIATIGVSYAFIPTPQKKTVTPTAEIAQSIEWLTWEEAVRRNKTNPKKIFVDVYTDWCGWCKKMDRSTFQDPKIVNYVNQNFYAVKLDAEMKNDVVHDGYTFKYVASGRRGYHQLAASLLDNRLSFPSFVAMDEKVRRITIIPGYHETAEMLTILKYIGGGHYNSKTFQEYAKTAK